MTKSLLFDPFDVNESSRIDTTNNVPEELQFLTMTPSLEVTKLEDPDISGCLTPMFSLLRQPNCTTLATRPRKSNFTPSYDFHALQA